jgi:ferredoxin
MCVDQCPAGAFTLLPEVNPKGVWLDPVSRTDWSLCRKTQGPAACMGHCLRVCPTGRSRSDETR